MDIQIQDDYRTPSRYDLKRSSQHIIVKLTKVQDKELKKSIREKWQLTFKGYPIKLTETL